MTSKQIEMKAIEKNVYVCPHCHTEYDDMESAKECMYSYGWFDNIDIESFVGHGLILKNQYNGVRAILPYTIRKNYVWTDRTPCSRRHVSYFNSFFDEYFNISPSNEKAYGEWILFEKLDITKGYEKYGLVPPLRYINKNIPDSVYSEMKNVIDRAIQERIEDFRIALNGNIEKMESLLAKFTLPDILTEDVLFLPKSRLIDTRNIYHLENVLPEFAKEQIYE